MPYPSESSAKSRMQDNSSRPDAPSRSVEILECTLRDGSYAVDFKFTENDTAILAGVLGRLGFRWIEVGHGVGLGAMQAGKGAMPSSDERLIEVAKRAAPDALIGCFFIPGIGSADPNGNGLPNWQEYLYGGNPLLSNGFAVWVSQPGGTTGLP